MDRGELRGWIEDAFARHDRDARERGETVSAPTRQEIVDSIWGRLPLEVRRLISRAQVEASVALLAARQAVAAGRDERLPYAPELGSGSDLLGRGSRS